MRVDNRKEEGERNGERISDRGTERYNEGPHRHKERIQAVSYFPHL